MYMICIVITVLTSQEVHDLGKTTTEHYSTMFKAWCLHSCFFNLNTKNICIDSCFTRFSSRRKLDATGNWLLSGTVHATIEINVVMQLYNYWIHLNIFS